MCGQTLLFDTVRLIMVLPNTRPLICKACISVVIPPYELHTDHVGAGRDVVQRQLTRKQPYGARQIPHFTSHFDHGHASIETRIRVRQVGCEV